MSRRRTAKKDNRRRGRPPIGRELDPWLAKMRPYIEADGSIREAALIVAKAHHHDMPRGSVHGRTLDSTIDLLRRKYPRWVKEKAEREAQRARARAAARALEKKRQAISAAFKKLGGPWLHPFDEAASGPGSAYMLKVQECQDLARKIEELKLVPSVTEAFRDQLESLIGCSSSWRPLHMSIGDEPRHDLDTQIKSQNAPDLFPKVRFLNPSE